MYYGSPRMKIKNERVREIIWRNNAEILPNLMKDINLQVQEAQQMKQIGNTQRDPDQDTL